MLQFEEPCPGHRSFLSVRGSMCFEQERESVFKRDSAGAFTKRNTVRGLHPQSHPGLHGACLALPWAGPPPSLMASPGRGCHAASAGPHSRGPGRAGLPKGIHLLVKAVTGLTVLAHKAVAACVHMRVRVCVLVRPGHLCPLPLTLGG